jgi:hypothetical protein
VSYANGDPVALDLYYDPVVDEHVAHGPMGIMAPTWYFAPQRPELALAGWLTTSHVHGVDGDGPITALDVPARTTSLLQFAGEFADAETKARIWAEAETHIEPMWDQSMGEFTLGFCLDEAYPRGQLNARAMAGWVCTPGAWARIFNEPNLDKFSEPTVEGVDFPRVALSEARWDGEVLRIAAHAQNDQIRGTRTRLKVTNLANVSGWRVTSASENKPVLTLHETYLELELTVDNCSVELRQA